MLSECVATQSWQPLFMSSVLQKYTLLQNQSFMSSVLQKYRLWFLGVTKLIDDLLQLREVLLHDEVEQTRALGRLKLR